jgi:hypothetical protein
MVHRRFVQVMPFQLALVTTLPLRTERAFGQAPQAPEPAQSTAQNRAPVVVGGKTLFYVEERILSFSTEDRARAISERISKLYNAPSALSNAIHVEEIETTSEIMAGDLVIMAVTENDARAAGRSRQGQDR